MPDSNGYLLPRERQVLLQHFAPVLVLFPEKEAHAPYPDDGDAIYTMRSSYHPRAVELFLKHARVRYRRSILLRHPWWFFRPRPLDSELDTVKQSITHDDLQEAMVAAKKSARFTGVGGADLRAAVLTQLIQERLAKRIRGFDLPLFRGHNLKQWRHYFKILAEADAVTGRSVVYGRVLQGLAPLGQEITPEQLPAQDAQYGPYDVSQRRVALQYWFHYYYDDWANRHEGDWECATILLELDPATISSNRELDETALLRNVVPGDVAFASHEDGYRRSWEDVQKTAEGHPLVYVARGSSASYFGWKLEGYPTSARVGFVERLLSIPGVFMRGKRFLGRRWDGEYRARFTGRDPKNTDWTAADPLPHDRLDKQGTEPLEESVPVACRGVRRSPDFAPEAGQDDSTYHLETEKLFWVEMVQEYGVQWGENYFLPGTKGPGGKGKAGRDKDRSAIFQLAKVEERIEAALSSLQRKMPQHAGEPVNLENVLLPLRPASLEQAGCFPPPIRQYVHGMWRAVLRSRPDAWLDGPGLYLRWLMRRQYKPGPLLEREDPVFHLKSLLAQTRRARYEIQNAGSKWDNPFAWVRYVCQADTFFYGVASSRVKAKLDINYLDCSDTDTTQA